MNALSPSVAHAMVFDINAQLTEHFTWTDVVRSTIAQRTHLNNTPPDSLLPALCNTAVHMEAVRTALGDHPISIDSWYRCIRLNELLHSHATSQHIKGEAVDWICPSFGTPLQLARALIPHIEELGIDQIILEYSWIHTSFCSNPNSKPRGNVLTLMENKGYAPGITDLQGNPIPRGNS